MDQEKLKRHNLYYLTKEGYQRLWLEIAGKYQGEKRSLVEDVLCGEVNVPGIARRNDGPKVEAIALGFVHYQRLNGNRIRIATFVKNEEVAAVLTPYEIMHKQSSARTLCMEACNRLGLLSASYGLKVGVLGSAGLELATGLPYTDSASDLDFLVKPGKYKLLEEFFKEARLMYPGINMDFELDLPNGYGVKLAEIFMDTRTVLGKSIDDVDLLMKKDVLKYL